MKNAKAIGSARGKARAKSLSAKQRTAIARHAAQIRWNNSSLKPPPDSRKNRVYRVQFPVYVIDDVGLTQRNVILDVVASSFGEAVMCLQLSLQSAIDRETEP